MVNVAAAKKRLGLRRRRACDIAHRKRRDSRRGFPDLHQTHRIVLLGGGLAAVSSFPDRGRPVTWKLRVDRTSDTVTGIVANLGVQSSIGFSGGDLSVRFNGVEFTGPFIGAPRDSAEIVVAFLPGIGQMRAWVDSQLVIAGELAVFPADWASSGSVTVQSIAGAAVRSDLDAFDGGLPRQFFESGVGTAVIPVELDDLLCRAAVWATEATSAVIFMEEPRETGATLSGSILYRAAKAPELSTTRVIFMEEPS